MLDSPFPQPLSRSSLVFLLVLNPLLHTPCISSQSSSYFRSTCPYHRSLFCCNINAVSSIPNFSVGCLLENLSFTLVPHIHLTILISARWSATTFSFLTGQVSLPCNMLLLTQLLYNLPLIISGTSLLVSSGTNCLNLFQPIRILASTAASASPSTLSMLGWTWQLIYFYFLPFKDAVRKNGTAVSLICLLYTSPSPRD